MGDSATLGADPEISEIAQRIIVQIERTNAKDLASSAEMNEILHLTDVSHTQTIFQHLDKSSTKSESNSGKKAVIEALLISTRRQRLYFVIRSLIMGIISAGITFSFIIYFGTINISLGVFVGIFAFIGSLVISRLLDVQIVKATKKVVSFLNGHKTLRDFILSHF